MPFAPPQRAVPSSSDVQQYTQLEPLIQPQPENCASVFELSSQNLKSQENSKTCDRSMTVSSCWQMNINLSTRLESCHSSSQLLATNEDDEESLQLARKRLRNRIAASKCRRRKLENIARLEEKVNHLKEKNNELYVNVKKLREQVCHLKFEVMQHNRDARKLSTSTNNHQLSQKVCDNHFDTFLEYS
ncbi:transcription factor AP-1-like protein [Leptotrombidium deliense]|uniref:Transcription factor AP-1-like protein n=1 Tax=Leptotrombidium deliense TaxID=299467 RepID=A0A443SAZ6_9ACAR|nr:transcription factor AP-1-like protein [Leptotrombidium deliense]